MEIKIEVQKLRERPLFLATPAYGGLVSTPYHISCIDLTTRFSQLQIPIKHAMIENESLITRARNNCVKMFMMAKEFNHLLFIDADIKFAVDDVLCLLALADPNSEYDVICGSYPKKSINWKMIKDAVEHGIPHDKLNEYIDNPVLNLLPSETGEHRLNMTAPVEVLDTGTGFMMIQKRVFEKMEKAFPELKYTPDYALHHPDFDKTVDQGVYAFFDVGVYSDQTSPQKESSGRKRYLSEDYLFCRRWRELGGKVWVCPWINLAHHGTYQYKGNIRDVLGLQSHIYAKEKEQSLQVNIPEVLPLPE